MSMIGWRDLPAVWMFLAITGGLPPGAGADPRDKTSNPASPSDVMQRELRRGRTLAARGRYAEAVAAFDAALRAVPDEPHVLSELGVALRETGDLMRAEEVCRKSAQATEPELRAPALYNLGRVLEQRGDRTAAIAAYTESLHLRANRVVRERLIALDPTATTEAMKTHPMQGPVASLDDWCHAQTDGCHFDEFLGATVLGVQGIRPDAYPLGRWLDVRMFVITEQPGWGLCAVGARTAQGWFIERLEGCAANGSSTFSGRLDHTLAASEGHVLQLRVRGLEHVREGVEYKGKDGEDHHAWSFADVQSDKLVVCGIGSSGVPHCTSSIDLILPVEHTNEDQGPHLDAKWQNGLLVLERADGLSDDRAKQRLAPSMRELLGKHRIIFP